MGSWTRLRSCWAIWWWWQHFLNRLCLLNSLDCLRLRIELLGWLPGWLHLPKLLNWDWVWLRTHELWLPEVWTKLAQHRGGDTHHGFFLLNSCYVPFGF
jgi:hypothetical protein